MNWTKALLRPGEYLRRADNLLTNENNKLKPIFSLIYILFSHIYAIG